MAKYVPRSSKKTSHVSAGLSADVLARVDGLAAAACVARAHFLGQLIRDREPDFDTIADRTSPASRTGPPLTTVAATVGRDVHAHLDEIATRHRTTVSRIVALIVDDALADYPQPA